MEAMNMFTEGAREIFMEGADRYGWTADREIEKAKKIARKMLERGDSPSEIAEVTDLSIDTIMEISNQMQKLPVGV